MRQESRERAWGKPRPYWARSNVRARTASVRGLTAVNVEDLTGSPPSDAMNTMPSAALFCAVPVKGLLVCDPRNLLPCRQSMEAERLAAA